MESTAHLLIGGLPLRLAGGGGVAAAMSLPGMRPFWHRTAAAAEVCLRLDAAWPEADCRWLHRFGFASGKAECCFGVDAEGALVFRFDRYGRLRFDPRRPDEVCLSPIADADLLRYALWTAYALAGLWRGRVPVHASAVVHRGRAVLCLGESGTGKSTHTSLWMRHIEDTWLLNDDSPIVAVEEGAVVAYGSPWSGKTPCYRTERVPVAALLRLEQRPQNSLRRLATVEAFTVLQPSCPPVLLHEERLTDCMVDFVGSVVGRVPVFRMGCLPDQAAARLSHDTIFPAQ